MNGVPVIAGLFIGEASAGSRARSDVESVTPGPCDPPLELARGRPVSTASADVEYVPLDVDRVEGMSLPVDVCRDSSPESLYRGIRRRLRSISQLLLLPELLVMLQYFLAQL
jgi:hypothetical protein